MKFMKNILGLNGCGISGEHIRCGIMERDGIGKVKVRSEAIYRLYECAINCATTNRWCADRMTKVEVPMPI
jgi:hypothetical protein